ncbi:MAG: PLP-dependent aminotransferase family protein [archaeon]|nr:MAG: PLP-dependent aminotransferase family protein [archaeon]
MRLAERTGGMKASEIRELLKVTEDKEIISFGGGLPSPDSFPIKVIDQLCSRVLKKYGTRPLQYGITEGITDLRETLAGRMGKFGIKCKKDNLIITNGTQEGLDLITKTFVNPKDTIALEVPTYLGAVCCFKIYQSRFLTVGMDSFGMKTGELEKKLKGLNPKKRKKVKFIYAIPNFHNPAGVTMSPERRKHLVEIAGKYDIPIIEDDPYVELRFSGKDVPSIKSLDKNGLVVYMSTFSKIFAPGMRLGWIVAEKELASKITILKQGTDLCTNIFCQYLANEYIKSGAMDRQLPKTRVLYKKKRDIMLEAVHKYFPEGCECTKPDGGMFLWVTLPKKIDTKKLFPEAVKHKVAYIHGAAFCVDDSNHNSLRLTFSNANIAKIEPGIKRLGNLIEKKLKK